MKLFGKMKIYIRKYIRKYMVVALSLIMFPLLSINSYAINDTYPIYSLDVNSVYSSYGVEFVRGDDGVYWADFANSSSSPELYIRLFDDNSESDTYLNFPILVEHYDYYVYTSYAQRTTGGDFMPSSIVFCTGDGRTEYPNQILEQNHYINRFVASNADYGIIQSVFVGKLNLSEASNITNKFGAIKFKGDTNTFLGRQYFEFAICMVPKSDSSSLDDIAAAINNQTSTLASKLDIVSGSIDYNTHILGGRLNNVDSSVKQGNNLIENGNAGTSNNLSNFYYVFQNFNEELGNIENFDTQIIGEFESANEQYLTELNNFELSASLLNAGNWLSTSMQTVYDNSSDYKMLWLVPLLLGIPLIILFLKKGSDDE